MEINDLSLQAKELHDAKGWPPREIGTDIALMHSELSEVLEEYRAGHGITEIYFNSDKPEGIPIELADVIIRIAQFCGTYNIDLEAAIQQKMQYNWTRPVRHGGKII